MYASGMMPRRLIQLEHTPITDSLHFYLNGQERSRGEGWTYRDQSLGQIVTGAGLQLRETDRLEARYAWTAENDPAGAPGGPGNPGTPGGGTSQRPLTPEEEFEDYVPPATGGRVCDYTTSTFRGTTGGGGPFGHDGYYNKLGSHSVIGSRQSDTFIRAAWGTTGTQSIQWLDRRGTGFVGRLVAIWLDPVTGCIHGNDIVSGGIGGHGTWNGSTYVFSESSWRSYTRTPPTDLSAAQQARVIFLRVDVTGENRSELFATIGAVV